MATPAPRVTIPHSIRLTKTAAGPQKIILKPAQCVRSQPKPPFFLGRLGETPRRGASLPSAIAAAYAKQEVKRDHYFASHHPGQLGTVHKPQDHRRTAALCRDQPLLARAGKSFP